MTSTKWWISFICERHAA